MIFFPIYLCIFVFVDLYYIILILALSKMYTIFALYKLHLFLENVCTLFAAHLDWL